MNAEDDRSVSGHVARQGFPIRVESWPNTYWLAFMVAVGLSAIIYLPSLGWTFGHDQNVFAEIGSLILRGKLPFRDAWDIKPPNIYYTYAIAQWIGGQNEFAIRLADYLSTLATSVILFCYVVALSPRKTQRYQLGIFASVLFTWIVLALGLADTAQTESASLPFLAGAMLAWKFRERSRFAILSGALIGIAAFFKTTNILFALPFFVDGFLRSKEVSWQRSIGWFLGGLALAAGCEIGFMASQGFLTDYIEIANSVFRLHGTEQTGDPITLFRAFRIIGLYSGLFGLTSLIGIVIAWFGKRSPERSILLREFLFLLLYVATGLLAVLVQRKGWGYHYVILLPGLAVLLTLGTAQFLERIIPSLGGPLKRYASFISSATLLLLFLFMPLNSVRLAEIRETPSTFFDRSNYLASKGALQSMYYPPCTLSLAKYIHSNTSSVDSIFILGQEPGAYWRSERLPATRYIYTLLFTSPMMTGARFAELNHSLIAHPPKLIAIERYDTLAFSGIPMTSEMLLNLSQLKPLKNLLTSDYVLTDTICGKFLAYIRKP